MNFHNFLNSHLNLRKVISARDLFAMWKLLILVVEECINTEFCLHIGIAISVGGV